MRESMTPRERWLATLTHAKPDRIPSDFRATREATDRILRHCNCADEWEFCEAYHIDPIVDVGPQYVGPSLPENTNVFGIEYTYVRLRYRCLQRANLPARRRALPFAKYSTPDEIEHDYQWPDPDWWDYRRIPEQVKGKEEQVIRGGGSEPFATYKDLRGVEQAYLDSCVSIQKSFTTASTSSLSFATRPPCAPTNRYRAESNGRGWQRISGHRKAS